MTKIKTIVEVGAGTLGQVEHYSILAECATCFGSGVIVSSEQGLGLVGCPVCGGRGHLTAEVRIEYGRLL